MPARHRRAERVGVLVSGGVESAALIAHFLRRGNTVHPIYIRGGYFWESAETHWLRRLLAAMASPRLKPLARLDVSAKEFVDKSHWAVGGRAAPEAGTPDEDVYLPGRNLLLLSAASVFCAGKGVDRIALGTLKGNPFSDATPAFFRRMGSAVSACFNRPFRISAPFLRLRKKQVVGRFPEVPWDLTFSCIAPRRLRPCLRCSKCEERRGAFSPT